MNDSRKVHLLIVLCLIGSPPVRSAEDDGRSAREAQRYFSSMDVFKLEYASDPRISPSGNRIVYVRNFMDIMKDQQRSSLWTITFDGAQHRPLTDGNGRQTNPRWSPDGKRVVYVSGDDGSSQLYVRWMDTGQVARLTQLARPPASLRWSPDGRWIAFSMLVPESPQPLVEMPKKPKNAEWAAPPKVISKLKYRSDGSGYLEDGYRHLFVVSSEGGSPRQLTFGSFNHEGGLAWTPDSQYLILSANRQEDWQHDPIDSELFELKIADASLRQLTDHDGPDASPAVSPDGSLIAFVSFDDLLMGHHTDRLYVMNRDGSGRRCLISSA